MPAPGRERQPSPHEILGVTPGASIDDIRRARRRLVKKYHPDVALDKERATRMLAEVNGAFEALTREEARPRQDETPRAQSARRESWEEQFERATRAFREKATHRAEQARAARRAAEDIFPNFDHQAQTGPLRGASHPDQESKARNDKRPGRAGETSSPEPAASIRSRRVLDADPSQSYGPTCAANAGAAGSGGIEEAAPLKPGPGYARAAYARARGEDRAMHGARQTGAGPGLEVVIDDDMTARMTSALRLEAARIARDRVSAARSGETGSEPNGPALHKAQRVRLKDGRLSIDLGSRASTGENVVAMPVMRITEGGSISFGKQTQLVLVDCKKDGRQTASADERSGLVDNARGLAIEICFSDQRENLRDRTSRGYDAVH